MAFAFLDENPCKTPRTRNHAWEVITADNAELFFWPVDVDAGYVTVTSGLMSAQWEAVTRSATQSLSSSPRSICICRSGRRVQTRCVSMRSTGSHLLRAVVKVSLGQLGYPDLWRSASWRAAKAAYDELERRAAGDPALDDGSGVG